jgi:hypothetical protein
LFFHCFHVVLYARIGTPGPRKESYQREAARMFARIIVTIRLPAGVGCGVEPQVILTTLSRAKS